MTKPSAYYRPPELARRLGLAEKTLYRWCQAGKIEATKVAGAWLIPAATADRLARQYTK
jgi:excisionase family DNA binding protein